MTDKGTKYIISEPVDYYWGGEGMEVWGKECSDGYHTFAELYEHRLALNVALFNLLSVQIWNDSLDNIVVKSKLHHDGTMFEGGYFVVACRNPQLSYHYKLEHWDKFKIPEVERVPWAYDGHTPQDTIIRLLNL